MSMKKVLLLLIFIFGLSLSIFSQTDSQTDLISVEKQDNSTATDDYSLGMVAYVHGDYYKAIDLFQKELSAENEKDLESPTLYYNLGNAYYRVNNLGKARLYYEKALLIKPNLEDAKFNIAFIENKVQKSVSIDGNFFIQNLLKKLSYTETSNTWNVLAIVAFIVFLVNVGVFFFTQSELIKKIVFYVGLVFIVISIVCNIFAFQLAKDIKQRNEAIVTVPSVVVYTAPDTASDQVTTLNEAYKLQITKDDNSWVEIKLTDGTIGWIQSSSIDII